MNTPLTNDSMKAGRFLKWATARRKHAWIQTQLAAGRTVYLSNSQRRTALTAKHAQMVRATRLGGLELQHGKSWLCHDYSLLSAS